MAEFDTTEKPSTWQRRLQEAKVKHRPTMKDWAKEGFSSIRATDLATLTEQRAYEFCKNIDRVHCDHISEKDFIARYEEPAIPVVIGGIPQREGWAALQGKWTDWEWLRTNLGERLFKVGEDDDGYKVKVKFKYFMRYLRENSDDSPLYVFDSTFDDDSVSSCLLNDYAKPRYFRDDLLSLAGESRRPPYRWFLCGPARSGTCVHIDPLGTSAWNTCLVGRKRWVIFPPFTHKLIAKAKSMVRKDEDDEAVNYFVDHLPRLLRQMRQDERQWALMNSKEDMVSTDGDGGSSSSTGHTSSGGSSRSTSTSSISSYDTSGEMQNPRIKYGCSSSEVIEFTQYPGETVFVPGDWWHAVLNLDDTVAVTQNFCSYTNFAKVWRETRSGRKKMACKWLRKLREQHPTLADKAEAMNKEDGFLMYYEKRALKEQKKKEKEAEVVARKAALAAGKAVKKQGVGVEDAADMTMTVERKSFKHESKHDAQRREKKHKEKVVKRKLQESGMQNEDSTSGIGSASASTSDISQVKSVSSVDKKQKTRSK